MLLDQAAPCPRRLHFKCISRGRVTLYHQYTNTLQHHPRGTGWLKKKKNLIFKSEKGATINSSQSHWREGCMGTLKFCQGPGLKTYQGKGSTSLIWTSKDIPHREGPNWSVNTWYVLQGADRSPTCPSFSSAQPPLLIQSTQVATCPPSNSSSNWTLPCLWPLQPPWERSSVA